MEKAGIKVPHDDDKVGKKNQLEIPGDCDIAFSLIWHDQHEFCVNAVSVVSLGLFSCVCETVVELNNEYLEFPPEWNLCMADFGWWLSLLAISLLSSIHSEKNWLYQSGWTGHAVVTNNPSQ